VCCWGSLVVRKSCRAPPQAVYDARDLRACGRDAQARPQTAKIGLALGGGAARGFAHIGVLQVLEENGIKPDVIVGTSAGSVVAALYASGKTPTQLGQMAMTLDESTITDWVFPGRSLLKGEALARFVRDSTGNKPIEAMRMPLGIVATDLQSGQPILFRRGMSAWPSVHPAPSPPCSRQ